MFAKQVVLFTITIIFVVVQVSGHGRLLDPPGRSSMWRFGFPTAINYDDMALNCGGLGVQVHQNGGKCGICGDDYANPTPRENEDGGKYGKGIVVAAYASGGQIPVFVQLTQEHLGYFDFGLCNLSNGPETDECFKAINLVGGAPRYPVTGSSQYVNHTMILQLPAEVTCDRCVLKWHYRGGNNNGICDDGSSALGCGDQETFVNCADITIQ